MASAACTPQVMSKFIGGKQRGIQISVIWE
jgi:hypothetical protein